MRERDEVVEIEVAVPGAFEGLTESIPALAIGESTIRRHRRFVADRLVFVVDADVYAELPKDAPVLFFDRVTARSSGRPGVRLADGLAEGGQR